MFIGVGARVANLVTIGDDVTVGAGAVVLHDVPDGSKVAGIPARVIHEPEASASPPGYRMATCVLCCRRMVRMWHVWLHEDGFKKEVHLCRKCGRRYR